MVKKGVFVHLHKCGGHTLKIMLFGKRQTNNYDCVTLAGTLHRRDHHYFGKWRWELDDWDDRFKFAILRNPFDRLVSAYRFVCQPLVIARRNRPNFFTGTFAEFVKLVVDKELAVTAHYRGWNLPLFFKVHTAPFASEGYHLPCLDYLGRFEDYEASIKYIFAQLDRPCPEIPHMHSTSDKNTPHYSRYYDAHSRELAEQYYWSDCELYDYAFEEA